MSHRVTQPHQARATLKLDVLRLAVIEGPCKGASLVAREDEVSIGSAATNDLVLDDSEVSRFHLTLRVSREGVVVRDAGSTNGTFVGTTRLVHAVVPLGTVLSLGGSKVLLESGGSVELEIADSAELQLAGLAGYEARSASMRRALTQVARAAQSDVPVLLVGESGTGKERMARAVHESGPRRSGPFETLDCASLSPTLVASELFGHEKGAFTGADRRHIGAFERAHGGTLFLDEIGDLPEALQPMLLGALERRRFRRLGARDEVAVDVRIVGATHRDLRAEVNANRFRLDLYYRLVVVRIDIPPLRERLEDLELLITRLAKDSGHEAELSKLLEPAFLGTLRRHDWPGNVRELRNVVDATLAMGEPPLLASERPAAPGVVTGGHVLDLTAALELPYKNARQLVLTEFERAFLPRLLDRAGGNVSQAARDADMDRSHLWEILRRHGLR